MRQLTHTNRDLYVNEYSCSIDTVIVTIVAYSMAAILSRTIRFPWTLSSRLLIAEYASENIFKVMESTSCFIGKEDHHNGVLVDSTKEPCTADHVVNRLRGISTIIYICKYI